MRGSGPFDRLRAGPFDRLRAGVDMDSNQPDLFSRVVTPQEMGWLEKLLLDGKCWMTAGDIALTTQGRVNDRDIREVASGSAMIISGQKGYKHVSHSTAEEINRCANGLESQAKKMSDRAGAIRRQAHKIFG